MQESIGSAPVLERAVKIGYRLGREDGKGGDGGSILRHFGEPSFSSINNDKHTHTPTDGEPLVERKKTVTLVHCYQHVLYTPWAVLAVPTLLAHEGTPITLSKSLFSCYTCFTCFPRCLFLFHFKFALIYSFVCIVL